MNNHVTAVSRAIGTVAVLVATKLNRCPSKFYEENLEGQKSLRAPLDLLFEMASEVEVGSFTGPPPLGLFLDPAYGNLGYSSQVARALVHSLAPGSCLFCISLDDSVVEFLTREQVLKNEYYNSNGTV